MFYAAGIEREVAPRAIRFDEDDARLRLQGWSRGRLPRPGARRQDADERRVIPATSNEARYTTGLTLWIVL